MSIISGVANSVVKMSIPPCQTLFVHGLPTRFDNVTLRNLIAEFCSPFGTVIEVNVRRHDEKQRGNAFVAFSDIVGATNALKGLNGKLFLGRPFTAAYARSNCARVNLLQGGKKKHPLTNIKRSTATAVKVGATLLVEDLPSSVNELALTVLFKQYSGFIDVKIIDASTATVDFTTIAAAEEAQQKLDGFMITSERPLKVSMQR